MIKTSAVQICRVAAKSGSSIIENLPRDIPVDQDAAKRTIQATGFHHRAIEKESKDLFSFLIGAAASCVQGFNPKAVIAATFSNETRFPSLAVRIASALKLPSATPAFDIQMACSAYPYAIYLASRISRDLGGEVLVLDADLQSRFIDNEDIATALVMDDCATASIVKASDDGESFFDFYSNYSEALTCSSSGTVKMDGFKVFSFVSTEVAKFLRPFGSDFDFFIPHRANMYMVRQLAKSLALESKLLAPDAEFANPGSSSIPLTLATCAKPGKALLAGFGAGLSAAASIVTLPESFSAARLA